ncbi:hypothetical protein VTH82DRAFT_6313 [Thermothelomyces myriococcoides]
MAFNHTIAPDGDVVLRLNNPRAPFAVWKSPVFLAQTKSPSVERAGITFLVSSHHLKLASPVFRAALTGPWSESVSAVDSRHRITADGWDPEALLILLNLIHGRNNLVSRTLSLELLCKVSVLVDYYRAHEAVRFPSQQWISATRYSIPQTYGRDLMLWLCISWVFQEDDIFEIVTKVAIGDSPEPISSLKLPIPATVIAKGTNLHVAGGTGDLADQQVG